MSKTNAKGGIIRHWPALLLGLAVALILVVKIFTYQVNETELAVVTTFGKVNPEPEQPGLHFRWPFPVEKIYKLDTRNRTFSGTVGGAAEEMLTKDGQNVVVSMFIIYRIDNPILFFTTTTDITTAEQRLNDWMRGAKSSSFGSFRFDELINANPVNVKLDQVAALIKDNISPQAATIGVAVERVGISALNVPGSITSKIFDRMIKEREVKAQEYRSIGETQARKIRTEADQESARIVAKARAEALEIFAQGDAEAAKYYAEFKRNPELAEFLRRLEALRQILQTRTTLVLDTNTPPFDLLKQDAMSKIGLSIADDSEAAAE